MPNDCWNIITIKASQAQIELILAHEFTKVPLWAFQILRIGKGALQFKIWSPSVPNKELINRLMTNYPGIWLKNEWLEEGGTAGVIVGDSEHVKELTWDEGCIEERSECWLSSNVLLTPSLKED